MIRQISLNCDGRARRVRSCGRKGEAPIERLADAVEDYIKKCRENTERERQFYAELGTLERAVENAALCRRPDGKRHSHQYRLTHHALQKALKALRATNLEKTKNFGELHALVKERIHSIKGIGDLTVYDVAHRIGAFLRLDPERIYLHAGAREGARWLGFKGKMLSYEFLIDQDAAFARLKPYEIEDFLCIYKDCIRNIMSGGVSAKTDDYTSLYHLAFEKYGSQALWNVRHFEKPTPSQALTITSALRTHGGMDGRRLAEQIEKYCRLHEPRRGSM